MHATGHSHGNAVINSPGKRNENKIRIKNWSNDKRLIKIPTPFIFLFLQIFVTVTVETTHPHAHSLKNRHPPTQTDRQTHPHPHTYTHTQTSTFHALTMMYFISTQQQQKLNGLGPFLTPSSQVGCAEKNWHSRWNRHLFNIQSWFVG